jgi:ferredoxin-type protein NapH
MKITTARKVTVALVLVLVVVGLAFNTGTGTPSSFGWTYIASICPLGVIEATLASKLLLPRALIVLILLIAVAVVLGKVFCAWLCPIPPIRRFFFPKKKEQQNSIEHHNQSDTDGEAALVVEGETVADGLVAESASIEQKPLTEEEKANLIATGCKSGCSSCAEKRKKLDSRHIVLGGALISTAIFGFPVFCLVCPVGLTFATVIALWRFVGFSEPSWMLIIFPAIVLIEVLVLRKWCLKWCPLGAVMSLMALPNRFLKPRVDKTKCLRYKGIECTTCIDVCEENLDPHFSEGIHECSKCGNCVVNCPSGAISIPFSSVKNGGDKVDPVLPEEEAA